MAHIYTALIQQRGDWWVGRIQEVSGVNCQERTRKKLIETLESTLRETLEANAQETRLLAENEYQEIVIHL